MTDDTAVCAEGDGRDAKGRFAAGNTHGRGNPKLLRLGALRDAIDAAVTPEALQEVMTSLLTAANKGDTQAATLLLHYCVGRPQREPSRVSVEFGPLESSADFSRAFALLARSAASGEVPADTVAAIATALRSGFDASATHEALDMLEQRLAELEGRHE